VIVQGLEELVDVGVNVVLDVPVVVTVGAVRLRRRNDPPVAHIELEDHEVAASTSALYAGLKSSGTPRGLALRWDDIDLTTGRLHVHRAKGGMPACIRYLHGKAGHRASSCGKRQHPHTSSSRNVAHRFPQPDISAWCQS